MGTAKAGWYQCVECDNYMLIDNMQAVKAIDMRILPNGELRGKCTNCYKKGSALYPRIRKTGFIDSMQLTWHKLCGDVKGTYPDGTS